MKRTVRLYGVLRQHFGRDFPLELSSPAEGINALCYLLPGFERFLRNAQARGLVFSVFAGARNLTEQDLLFTSADDSLVTRGSFPALMLAPVNFDALYAQELQRMQEEGSATVQ